MTDLSPSKSAHSSGDEALKLLSQVRVHGGWLKRYQHPSSTCQCDMVFAIFVPKQTVIAPMPVLYWLSGLTCTDENFSQKAGAFAQAQALGMVLVMPDTSPRACYLPNEDDSYDLGTGAGFYVNATQSPWRAHYQMFDYVNLELPKLVETCFKVTDKRAICGHSMGGHGALISALKQPGRYVSVSAFAPISSPSQCPWGQKALGAYLGDQPEDWSAWDANELVKSNHTQGITPQPLLIDQGGADPFLQEQLQPDMFIATCKAVDHPLTYHVRQGYDHSYFYISSFINEHLHYHARHLDLL